MIPLFSDDLQFAFLYHHLRDMSHQKAFDTSLDCDCFGCTRSVMCGFNGAERCDVCVFDMKNWKHPRRCLISVCTKMSVKGKNDCIMEYNRLLSEHMQVSVLSEGDDVFCSWHINGVSPTCATDIVFYSLMFSNFNCYFDIFSAGIGARYKEDTKVVIAKAICTMFNFTIVECGKQWNDRYVLFLFLLSSFLVYF